MLVDVHLRVLFERALTIKELKLFADSIVGSIFMGMSPVTAVRRYRNSEYNEMFLRLNISHDMSERIKNVKLSHHLAKIPPIVSVSVVEVKKIDDNGRVKIVVEA